MLVLPGDCSYLGTKTSAYPECTKGSIHDQVASYPYIYVLKGASLSTIKDTEFQTGG